MGKRSRRWLAALGLTVLLVEIGSFWMLWGDPASDYWAGGDMKFGDLAQHYGAGLFWQKNRAQDLYQSGHLGKWLDEFKRRGRPGEPARGTAGFNYVYSPLVAWVASAATGKTYAQATTTWFGFSLLIWAAALLVLRRLLGWRWDDGVVWVWAVSFPAAYFGLVLGQNHVLTLLVVVAAGWLLQQRREVAAGLVLSCLFYKPQWGVFLAVMMGLWGHWRVSLGWCLGTVGWFGLMVSLCGWNLVAAWAAVLPGMETGAQNQVDNLNQTWRALLSTSVPWLPKGAALGIAGVVWAGFAAGLAWKRRHIPPRDRRLRDLWEAAALGVFTMPYVMHYDAIMFLPLWLLAACAPETRGIRWAVIGTVLAGWASINLWETSVAWMAPVWTIMFFGLLRLTRAEMVRNVV